MTELGPVTWPPAPIRTERLVLRESEARDLIGQVILSRATGHGPPAAAGKAQLGYLFLPGAWGCGYATEACAAALGWFAGELRSRRPVELTPVEAHRAPEPVCTARPDNLVEVQHDRGIGRKCQPAAQPQALGRSHIEPVAHDDAGVRVRMTEMFQ